MQQWSPSWEKQLDSEAVKRGELVPATFVALDVGPFNTKLRIFPPWRASQLLLAFNPRGFEGVMKWAASLQDVTVVLWDPDRALGRRSFACPKCAKPVQLDGWTPKARLLRGLGSKTWLYSRRGACFGAWAAASLPLCVSQHAMLSAFSSKLFSHSSSMRGT